MPGKKSNCAHDVVFYAIPFLRAHDVNFYGYKIILSNNSLSNTQLNGHFVSVVLYLHRKETLIIPFVRQ